jgi:putative DNA primase/helicase
VLYVDGELPQETLQRRLHDVAASIGASPTPDLRLLTPDQQNGARIPNLADPQGQRIIEDCIAHEQAELAILDNLSTLCRSGEENAAESWQVIQDWLVLLRSKRISVLLLHHAGKSGDQRGTSKREDVLDVSLRIARPKDYHPEQGARFEVHFEKGRDAFGTAVTPFEARLEGTDWSMKTLTDARDELIRKLDEEGLTYRQIAAEAGCGVATVNRVLKAAKA